MILDYIDAILSHRHLSASGNKCSCRSVFVTPVGGDAGGRLSPCRGARYLSLVGFLADSLTKRDCKGRLALCRGLGCPQTLAGRLCPLHPQKNLPLKGAGYLRSIPFFLQGRRRRPERGT